MGRLVFPLPSCFLLFSSQSLIPVDILHPTLCFIHHLPPENPGGKALLSLALASPTGLQFISAVVLWPTCILVGVSSSCSVLKLRVEKA